jgi:acetyl-CoA carboxylase biotin carboxyl carrier protein
LDIQQIRELIELMIEKDVAEVQLEQHGVHVRIRRPEPVVAGTPATMLATAAPAVAAAAPGEAAESRKEYDGAHMIRSPMVGTFYTAPEPGADPFVQIGERVEEGQTLCIIEAMKLMNEITADVAGEIVGVLQENGQPVEYGQELFAIRT